MQFDAAQNVVRVTHYLLSNLLKSAKYPFLLKKKQKKTTTTKTRIDGENYTGTNLLQVHVLKPSSPPPPQKKNKKLHMRWWVDAFILFTIF